VKLSVVIPVYNEERTLPGIMKEIAAACPEAQIIYIDDGSTDRSLAILRNEKRPQDLVVTKPNGGKGSAIREGLKHAEGQFTVIQDADLEYDPREIGALVKEAEKNPGSGVLGSRFLKPNPNIYRRYLLGNKFLTALINVLFGAHLTDSYTCYKLLPTELFRSLQITASGFELEAEICARCLRSGISLHEIPISYRPRSIEEGKKITWKDGLQAIWTILRLRFLDRKKYGRTQNLRTKPGDWV